MLERYRSSNRWLDIGCGVGTLLQAATNRGWDATGTEVAFTAAETARRAGLDARHGQTHELALPDSSYDIVSMIEIVEHVGDLDDLLAEAERLVRPGGAVYLTTPHGRGLAARLLKTSWSTVAPPEHLQLFSSLGLQMALDRAGLVVKSSRTHGMNVYELAAGVRSGPARAAGRSSTETSYRA